MTTPASIPQAFFGVTLRRNDPIFKDTFFDGCPFKFRVLKDDLYLKTKIKEGGAYLPFMIKWNYPAHPSMYDRWTNVSTLSHDVMHALDFFMRDQRHRLLKPDFGLGAQAAFTFDHFKFEVNVLAMQYAALSTDFNWQQIKGWGKDTIRKNVLIRVSEWRNWVFGSLPATIDDLVDERMEYWKGNYSMLHAKYKEMTAWINTQRMAA